MAVLLSWAWTKRESKITMEGASLALSLLLRGKYRRKLFTGYCSNFSKVGWHCFTFVFDDSSAGEHSTSQTGYIYLNRFIIDLWLGSTTTLGTLFAFKTRKELLRRRFWCRTSLSVKDGSRRNIGPLEPTSCFIWILFCGSIRIDRSISRIALVSSAISYVLLRLLSLLYLDSSQIN